MITQEILIDVNNHIAPEVVSRLGESNVRQLLIKPVFYNPDGTYTQIVIDSENVHGMFRMVKPDGTFVTTNMALATPSSDPAVFVVTLTGAMSQVAGRGYYDVRIGDTEDASEFIYSAQGLFTIDDDMLQNAVESVAEANGFVFPDDFLTSADLEDYVTDEELQDVLEDYVTDEELQDALENIDTKHNYSTNEQIVGNWIDDKPIYEKTINIGALSKLNSWQSFSHNIANLKRVINCNGWMLDNTGGVTYMYPIPENRPNTQNGVCIEVTLTDINIFHNWLDNVSECYITITYTKTTD